VKIPEALDTPRQQGSSPKRSCGVAWVRYRSFCESSCGLAACKGTMKRLLGLARVGEMDMLGVTVRFVSLSLGRVESLLPATSSASHALRQPDPRI